MLTRTHACAQEDARTHARTEMEDSGVPVREGRLGDRQSAHNDREQGRKGGSLRGGIRGMLMTPRSVHGGGLTGARMRREHQRELSLTARLYSQDSEDSQEQASDWQYDGLQVNEEWLDWYSDEAQART